MSQKVGTTEFVLGCAPLHRERLLYCFNNDCWQQSITYSKNMTGRDIYKRVLFSSVYSATDGLRATVKAR